MTRNLLSPHLTAVSHQSSPRPCQALSRRWLTDAYVNSHTNPQKLYGNASGAQLPLTGQQPISRVLPTSSQSLLSVVPGIPHALKLSQGKIERSVCRASEAPRNGAAKGAHSLRLQTSSLHQAPSRGARRVSYGAQAPQSSHSRSRMMPTLSGPTPPSADSGALRKPCAAARISQRLWVPRIQALHASDATRKVLPSMQTQRNALA